MRELHKDEERAIHLIYADDHAIVTNTPEDLQREITEWNDILTLNGMKISKEKTETMVLSRTPGDIDISLDGHILKQSRNFKYLGVMFG